MGEEKIRGWYVTGIDLNFVPPIKPDAILSGPHTKKRAEEIADNYRYGIGAIHVQVFKV